MRISFMVAGLLSLAASPSWAAVNVHSINSDKPLQLIDASARNPTQYNPTVGYSVTSWKEGFTVDFSNAYAEAGGNRYEFNLMKVTTASADEIKGRWNIFKNGRLVCHNCMGKAYGLSQPIGNYFKIYIGTPNAYLEKWHFSAYITSRFDY